MLHRNVKGKGILLRLTRNNPARIESSDRVIEEPFTTFHDRILLRVNLLGMFVVYQPLPETFIKMFNFKIFAEDENWLDIRRLLLMA